MLRSPSQVEQERNEGRARFAQARSGPLEVGPGHGAAREARTELERREAVRQREQEALSAQAVRAIAGDGTRPRAVIVHRAAWIREALCRELVRAGVEVVDMHEDGAAGLGSVVAEQPDLVVVEQQLPWKDGLEVVREVRRFAPAAAVAVHLDQPQAEQQAREAGAHAVFPRPTRPADMIASLLALTSS